MTSPPCVDAADGAAAMITVPFPPLPRLGDATAPVRFDHAQLDRRIGAVLVRRGGWAVGVFAGSELVDSKVGPPVRAGQDQGRRLVPAALRPAPGQQAAQAYAEAADAAARILLPRLADLEAVVARRRPGRRRGGAGRPAAGAVRDQLTGPVLPTPDPRLRVLQAFPDQFRAVVISLNELA